MIRVKQVCFFSTKELTAEVVDSALTVLGKLVQTFTGALELEISSTSR